MVKTFVCLFVIVLFVVCFLFVAVVVCFTALVSALEQTHCALVTCDSTRVTSFF